jgi:hypothetical protein
MSPGASMLVGVMKRRLQQISFLLAWIPVFLVGQAAFGEWGLLGVYAGVVFLQQLVIEIIDRKRRRPSR